jgi:hypothetical protein
MCVGLTCIYQVVHSAVVPPCTAALQCLHALYSAMLRVQEGCDASLDPSFNTAVLRALVACKVCPHAHFTLCSSTSRLRRVCPRRQLPSPPPLCESAKVLLEMWSAS